MYVIHLMGLVGDGKEKNRDVWPGIKHGARAIYVSNNKGGVTPRAGQRLQGILGHVGSS